MDDHGVTSDPAPRATRTHLDRSWLLAGSAIVAAVPATLTALFALDSLLPAALVIGTVAWSAVVIAMLVLQVRELRASLSHDQMTGMFNRQHFEAQLRAALAQCGRLGTGCVVMMLDVDRFKEINDGYGHQAGDELLRQVGERLAGSVREYDTVARYGGEEFAVVMPHADEDAALIIAERLRLSCARAPFVLSNGVEASVSLSIGYALYPEDSLAPDDLVRRADLALYTCKRYGRNQLRRCDASDMSAVDVERHRELIETLAAVVDLRDWGTGEHAREVSTWSKQLAEAMALDPVSVSTVEAAALVHDIGKVGVPDGILRKPGPLEEPEWDVIREHPGWGAEIVGRVSNMDRVARIVEQHQEWTNGAGYPFGLQHDQIDVGARIISVVDAFHAMVGDRPYRTAMSAMDAVGELRRMAGTQFDEACVRVFCELVERGIVVPSTTPRPGQAQLEAVEDAPADEAAAQDDAQAA